MWPFLCPQIIQKQVYLGNSDKDSFTGKCAHSLTILIFKRFETSLRSTSLWSFFSLTCLQGNMACSTGTMAKALNFIYGFLMRPKRVPLTGFLCLTAETRMENYPTVLLAYRTCDSVLWILQINLLFNDSSCPVTLMASGVCTGGHLVGGMTGAFGLGDGTLSLFGCTLHQPWGALELWVRIGATEKETVS